MLWKKNTDQNIGWLQLLDLGPISWLCLLPNSALTITIPRLRASAEFLHLPCKRRMSSNVEYARAEAKIPRLLVKYTCHKHKIICFRKCRFFAYGKQSHEIGPWSDTQQLKTGDFIIWRQCKLDFSTTLPLNITSIPHPTSSNLFYQPHALPDLLSPLHCRHLRWFQWGYVPHRWWLHSHQVVSHRPYGLRNEVGCCKAEQPAGKTINSWISFSFMLFLRKIDWSGTWTNNLRIEVPSLDQLSYPSLCCWSEQRYWQNRETANISLDSW